MKRRSPSALVSGRAQRGLRLVLLLGAALWWAPTALLAQPAHSGAMSPQAAVGRQLFFDPLLSSPPGTSCAHCHNPQQGWGGNNGARDGAAVGSAPGARGARNSPTVGYVGFTPPFSLVEDEGKKVASGGLFWDGRVDSLEAQARGPLFSPAEMNLANEAELAQRLRQAAYAQALRGAFNLTTTSSDMQWADAGLAALAAFQRSTELAPFSSRYDAMLRGELSLSPAEARGRRLFLDKNKGNCAACHAVSESSRNPVDHLFTDHTYDNLGLPRNPALAANANTRHFDLGLCGPQRTRPVGLDAGACGAFKTPTLRNVAKRPFYFHNGSFTDLAAAVRFYVRRDTHPQEWYPRDGSGKVTAFNDLPQRYRSSVNRDEAPYDRRRGQRPRLNETEIHDLVVFLKTLDDGFKPD